MLIDTHAHVLSEYYSRDEIEEIFKGQLLINIIGFDIKSSEEVVLLSNSFENAFASVGVHPYDVSKLNDSSLNRLEKLAEDKKVIAIGEIGLDYFRDITPKELQWKYFENQIALAMKLNLPFIIHSRMAFLDTISIIKSVGYFRGVFHSFDYGIEEVKTVLDLGFFVSFSGMVTFKGRENLKEAMLSVPLERLLFETDSPYLSPAPLRGRKNVPANVRLIYDYYLGLKQMDDKLYSAVCNNFFNIFEKANQTMGKEVACLKF